MTNKVLINGIEATDLSYQDRGLQYGDGLFETIAVIDKKCQLWDAHIARLQSSCQRLNIPFADPAQLQLEAQQLITQYAASDDRYVLKIIYTRGSSSRGYKLPENTSPTRIISLSNWPVFPALNAREGIKMRLCETRLSNNSSLAGMKHLNRLEQVLARSEWQEADIAEGLMLDQHGYVIEGTMSNLFFIRANTLCTPSLQTSGVAGVMREHILQFADTLGIPTMIDNFTIRDVVGADEIFVSNSLINIWPVREVLMEPHRILSAPGLITRKIQVELGA